MSLHYLSLVSRLSVVVRVTNERNFPLEDITVECRVISPISSRVSNRIKYHRNGLDETICNGKSFVLLSDRALYCARKRLDSSTCVYSSSLLV